MSLDVLTSPLIIALLAVFAIGLCVWLAMVEVRLRRLFRGKSGSLENVLARLGKQLDALAEQQQADGQAIQSLQERAEGAIRGVSTIRFNPFKGTSGSNQSFATALLDAKGNGVVISSLYSRERMSVFAKPVMNGTSEYDLSTEESDAIKKAQQQSRHE